MFYRKKRQEDEPTSHLPPMSNAESRGCTKDNNSLLPPPHDARSVNDSEEAPVNGERMSTLPLPSMPWVENELIDEKRPVVAAPTHTAAASSALLNKALPSTPPLSPSSSTSETLVRNNSTRSSNSSSHGMTATGIKMVCLLQEYVYVYIRSFNLSCVYRTFKISHQARLSSLVARHRRPCYPLWKLNCSNERRR